MSRLNLELNGDLPSERSAEDATVPVAVAYAVSEVCSLLRSYRGPVDAAGRAADAAWRGETAWNGALAGDIDDIAQHLLDEGRASET